MLTNKRMDIAQNIIFNISSIKSTFKFIIGRKERIRWEPVTGHREERDRNKIRKNKYEKTAVCVR